ncbi:MAG: site-specific integrase, partial [Caldilineaceae bacterium]|nr:site-specific integrase [Caldilineaceae bacterium]
MSENRIVSSSIDREINDFVIDREVRDLTRKTILWYRNSLAIFAAWLNEQHIATTADITTTHMRQFLIHLKDRGHSPSGRANVYGAVRSYLRWYKSEHDLTDWDPLHKVIPPKRAKEVKQPIDLADFQKLIAVCKGSSFFALRDRALFMVLLDTGVRKQELTDLVHGDVNLANGEIYIRSGKGRKSRT